MKKEIKADKNSKNQNSIYRPFVDRVAFDSTIKVNSKSDKYSVSEKKKISR